MPTLRQLFLAPEIGEPFGQERIEQVERALLEDRKSAMPWYLRFIVGVGAWLASCFFLGFAFVLFNWDDNHRTAFGVCGIPLLFLCVLVARKKPGVFISQCCLAVSLAAQGMIYFGFVPEHHHPLGSAAAFSITLAVLLYVAYPDFLQRLITCFVALQITLAWIYFGSQGDGIFTENYDRSYLELMVIVYWTAHLAGIAACFLRARRQSVLLAPLGYALLASLAAWHVENIFNLWSLNRTIAILPLWIYYLRPIFTAMTLLGAATWACGGIEALPKYSRPLGGLALALVALIWLGAGGVLLALLFILLGFSVQSGVIRGLGLILLPVFLTTYYYNLHLDLLAKSAALIGSGLALLLLRESLKRWVWADQKEAP